MRREVQLLGLFLAWVAIATCTGCRHKPAYDEIDANRSSSIQNRNSEVQAGTTPAPGGEPSPAASQPAPSPPPTQSFKTPKFIINGNIKDLPDYPRASRVTVQIVPNQGINVMTLVLQTGDSMDAIASFYQQVIKDHKWTLVDKSIDPDMSEWILQKGEENSAKIQVKRDPTTGRMNIFVIRGETLEETNK